MHFPARRVEGWLWTSRWQLEILLGWNDWESLAWCRRSVSRGSTVLDVGAHIGYYSRLFAKLTGPRGKVFAIEAFPENYDILTQNCRKYQTITSLQFAAAAEEGTSEFYVSPGSSNHSLQQGYTPATAVFPTLTRRLDNLLAEIGISAVDFIKIDVEGAEPLVLQGLKQTITRSPHVRILIEYNPAALRCGLNDPHELIDQLRALGFLVYKIEEDASLTIIDNGLGPDIVNLLCCTPQDTPR